MQSLCQHEVLDESFLAQLDEFLADESPGADVVDYARELVRDCEGRLEEIDAAIQGSAEHWDVKRMAAVDRNTLRVAVCELLHRPDVPAKVAINEAVDIGKLFGTAESGGFINGVLDAVLKRRDQIAPDAQAPVSANP